MVIVHKSFGGHNLPGIQSQFASLLGTFQCLESLPTCLHNSLMRILRGNVLLFAFGETYSQRRISNIRNLPNLV